jgi:hypothetical protein
MSTPTVTENIIALEPVTRDDFGDEPAPAHTQPRAGPRAGARVHLSAPHMSRPPLTPQTWPVMYAEASAARNATTRAISSGRPMRRIGIAA